jgi:BlaI family penicillinase repressor
MGETTPSENEWLIMEVIWGAERPLTAVEIIERLDGRLDVTAKTIRVMINRLLSKGVIDYQVDKKDSRVYHYYAVQSKEDCLSKKKARFVQHYFGGDEVLAVASFLETTELTQDQLAELERLVQNLKGR